MHGTLNATDLESDMGPVLNSAPHWYALLVMGGRERKVCIWLRRRQYSPYWPRYRGQVKLNRHRRAVRWKSVIAGYVFLPHVEWMNWRLIEEGPNVIGFMRNAGTLIKIPNLGREGIEGIKSIEESLNASPLAAADGIPFKEGQKVWVSRMEQFGTILSIEKGRKLIVELLFLGSKRPIPLPVSDVEAA